VFELALRKSNGFEWLERDQEYFQAKGSEKGKVTKETNAQGECLRMFMQLSMLKILSMLRGDSPLFPDFEQALERAKGRLQRGQRSNVVEMSTPSRALLLEAGSSPAGNGGGSFRRQVLPHHHHPPTHPVPHSRVTTFL
jgi:hypothetical protein